MTPRGWTSIVITKGAAYLASDRESVRAPVSAGAIESPRHILDRAARLIHGNAAGVVLVDAGAETLATWKRQTLPMDRQESRVVLVDDDGWTATGVEPWTTWRSKGAPAIHVGFMGAIDMDRTPLWTNQADRADVVRALAWYHREVGAPWHMTGGVAAHTVIRTAYAKPGRQGQPYWGTRDRREQDDPRTGAGDLMWSRAPLREEYADGWWVHTFDLNAARLSALGVGEYAYGRLTRTGAIAFDPTLAGYWLIPAPRQHKRHPPLIDPADIHGGEAWPTTPIVKHLLDQGRLPEIRDSWTTEGKRIFRPIAERWNRARKLAISAGNDLALNAVKATYREGAGLFAKPGGSIYRPDWYHTAMDRQRVTLLSHTERVARDTGRRPVAIKTDALSYACPEQDPRTAAEALGLRLGLDLGTFRHTGTIPALEFWRPR